MCEGIATLAASTGSAWMCGSRFQHQSREGASGDAGENLSDETRQAPLAVGREDRRRREAVPRRGVQRTEEQRTAAAQVVLGSWLEGRGGQKHIFIFGQCRRLSH